MGYALRGPVTGTRWDGSVSSPPVVPNGEIGLAGGSGCSRSSGGLTEQISPTSQPSAFLHGVLVKEGSMGATGVNLLSIKGDEFGIRSLCESAVAPCPSQICSPGLEPTLLLKAKHRIFMRRGRCFSPPASRAVLHCLWSVLSLGLAMERAPGGLCLGMLHVKEDVNWIKKSLEKKSSKESSSIQFRRKEEVLKLKKRKV